MLTSPTLLTIKQSYLPYIVNYKTVLPPLHALTIKQGYLPYMH